MSRTLSILKIPNLTWTFPRRAAQPAPKNSSVDEIPYAERERLRELIARNPEVVQSEFGVMAMMAQYPRIF